MRQSRSLLLASALVVQLANACAQGGPGTDEADGAGLPDEPDATAGEASDAALGPSPDAAPDPTPFDAALGPSPDAAPASTADAAVPPGGAVLVVPVAPGGKAVGDFMLPASPKQKRLTTNSCAGSSLTFSSAMTSFTYVELRNPSLTQAVVVSAWTSRAPGGPIIDTIVAAYAGATPPVSDAERLECSVGVEQGCAGAGNPTACVTESDGSDWAGLIDADGRGVTIPAGGSVSLYVAAYGATEAGALRVSVRTEEWL